MTTLRSTTRLRLHPVGRRLARLVALLPGVVFLSLFTWRAGYPSPQGRVFTLFDDAMISLTYARTLAATGELVWYPGAPAVEGFTNPLWTLYLALLHAVGLEGSEAALAVSITGIVLLVVTGWLVAELVDRGLRGQPDVRWMASLAGGSVPLTYPLAFWAVGGMEVGLLAFLGVCLAVAATRALDAWAGFLPGRAALAATGLAGAIGVLTRIDFAVIAVGAAALLIVWAPRGRRRDVLTLVLAPLVATAIGVLVWQQAYYGDWLPNTYHLKMEGFSFLDRLPRGLRATGKVLSLGIMTLSCLSLVLKTTTDSTIRRLAVLLTGCAMLTLAYSVWVGGDAWEDLLLTNRYVCVALPGCLAVIVLGVAALVRQLRTGTGRRLHSTVVVGVLAALGGTGAAVGCDTPVLAWPLAALQVLSLSACLGIGVFALRDTAGESASAKGPAMLGA